MEMRTDQSEHETSSDFLKRGIKLITSRSWRRIKTEIMRFLIVLVFALVLGACQKNDEDIGEPTIDPMLDFYFELFAGEGFQRGIEVDFKQTEVSGYFADLSEANVTAQCQHDPNYPDRVVIDQAYWEQASDIEREFVVFHELGHCYLKRSHLDQKNPDGTCLSIMHSSGSVCNNTYRETTRIKYLDELFSN